jgi:GNAT superfamily N-acetyltransferase
VEPARLLPIVVRPAVPGDLETIRSIAAAAWRTTYIGLVDADAIERFLARAYAPERLEVRLARNEILVALLPGRDPGGPPDAFAETVDHGDHVQLVAIYTWPTARGQGLGSALLEAVVARNPGRDLAADVLVGNVLGEPFYVARGFEPGDELVEEIAGELIRERRWWLRPPARPRET